MHDCTSSTVSVGLDVHAASIRLAAVRADELLDERTLAYDHEAVARELARWPGVRCCYEAGPTGFGLYRDLSERGIGCEVVAPGLVPSRPGAPRSAFRLRPSSWRSTTTYTRSTCSTGASRRSRERSPSPPSRDRGPGSWRGCAACAASTRSPPWRSWSRSVTSPVSRRPRSS